MINKWLKAHRLSIACLFLIITLFGIFTSFKMPVALFPNIQFPRIIVEANVGDMPINQMVTEVTKPLEHALRSVPGVEDIRSSTNRGTAELSLNFAWGHNMVVALLEVQAALNQVSTSLPPDITLNARRTDPTNYPIVGISLTSSDDNLVTLRKFAIQQLQPLLSSINGVANVEVQGGNINEFQVIINPLKMAQHSVTTNDIIQALSDNNMISSVGRIEDRYRLYLIMSGNYLTNIDGLKQLVVKNTSSGIIQLKDVAIIQLGIAPNWTKMTSNNKNAVLLNITQQMGANTVQIAKDLQQILVQYKNQIPSNITTQTFYDQSQLINSSATSVRDAIIIGVFLAAIVVLFFLHNIRLTFIVLTIVPCVMATSILILYLLGMSFNIMTLGGMAAAVGLIIDDAVVMIEHIVRRIFDERQLNKNLNEIDIINFGMEMSKPILSSSLATVVIFIPLVFLNGITGGFFKALAVTMGSSLMISFFFSYLIIPVLSENLLGKLVFKHKEHRFLNNIKHIYTKIMHLLFENSKLIFIFIFIFVTFGLYAYNKVDSGFMPHMDEGGFTLDYKALPGTSLAETDRLLRQVEKIILATPEVTSYSRRTGAQLGGGLTEPYEGDYFIHLKNMPRRNIDAVMTDVRNRIIANVPGLQIDTAQLIEDMIGDLTSIPQPIEIKIFGNSQNELIPIAKQIANLITKINGVVEVNNGIIYTGNNIDIKLDPIKVASTGLSVADIDNQLRTKIAGSKAGHIYVNNNILPIRIFESQSLHQRIEQLRSILIRSTDGKYIPLSQIATIKISSGQVYYNRENLQPMLAVTGRIEGRGIGSTMNDIKTAINKINLPSNVYIQYGGLYQQQLKAFHDLIIVFICAELLVSILLLITYENIFIMLSIFFTTLLTLPGIFIGLYVTHTELNISSMMGMTMIIGMMTEIAIFYFTEINVSAPSETNLILAGNSRMRPILMTAIIAILALLPLAIGIGTGAAMQQPLAIGIISGIICGVPLILVVMPQFYHQLNKLGKTPVVE